jgi:hypothetical protein
MPAIDFYDVAAEIHRLITGKAGAAVAVRKYFDFCARHFPGSMWSRLQKLDIASDLENLQSWLANVLTREPPGGITAYWFGMFNPVVGGAPTCCLYVAGSSTYRPGSDDPDTFCDPRYFPEGRYSESNVLGEIYRLATRGRMARNSMVEEFGCLGFAAIAIAHLMRTVDRRLLLGRAQERAVAVGFDSGDVFMLGVIGSSGFEPVLTARPEVPKIVRTPSPREFYELKDDTRGRWWLEQPQSANGREPDARTGRRLKLSRPLKGAVKETPKGSPVDFTFAVLGTPVVKERVGRMLEALAPASVQRIPVRISGRPGRYEVLNFLEVVDCIDTRRSRIVCFPRDEAEDNSMQEKRFDLITKLVIDEQRARGHDLFLLAGARNCIIVSRRVKERLEAEKVTGILFKPV